MNPLPLRLLLLCLALPLSARAVDLITDLHLSGTGNELTTGTFTIQSGATLAIDSGATTTFGDPLTLANGGTGAALSDPGADRIPFWDDSAGAVTWLTVGSGLTLTTTTLTADITSAAPTDADYITGTATAGLSAEQSLGALTTGLLLNTVATGTGTLSTATPGTDYLAPDGDGSALTDVDAATGDSATAFFDAGTIEHERGGLEADVSAYAGLLAISGGSTSNITDLAGLNTALSTTLADNPMTTAEDIVVGGASGAPARLGAGTEGQVLSIVSGAVAWDDAAAAGFANPMTTAEDLIVGGTSGAAGRLAAGTEGQVLSIVSGAVAWDDAAGGGGAPTDAQYIVATADGTLSAEQSLGALTTGLLLNTVTTGVGTLSKATAGTHYVAPGDITTAGFSTAGERLIGKSSSGTGGLEYVSLTFPITFGGSATLGSKAVYPLSLSLSNLSNTSTTETTLDTLTLNTINLPADHAAVRMTHQLWTAGNANNKRIRIKVDSTTIFDSGNLALNGKDINIVCTVSRVTTTQVRAWVTVISNDHTLLPATSDYNVATVSLGPGATYALTVQSDTAGNDIGAVYFSAERLQVP